MSSHAFDFALDLAWSWAAERDFAGIDPYDALRSPALNRLHDFLGRPFGIAVTQLIRRSPVNVRPLLGIKPSANAKGFALFLTAAARTKRGDQALALADRLREMRSPGWDLPCWGYPFPWRSRAFYLPAGTPTIVATSFVGEAFLDSYSLHRDPRDLEMALGACDFIQTLHRTEDASGVCLAYSPLDRSAVYNASLLGARLFVRAALASGRSQLLAAAGPLVRYALARQHSNGSWPYGEAKYHRWIDSFHTGFVLGALDVYARATGDSETGEAVARGASYYCGKFFGPAGEPFYHSDGQFPYDVHSAAQGLVTLCQLRASVPGAGDLAARVGQYLIENFLAADGHFRYQIRRTHRVSIPYMRWSQAWGVRGLAALVESRCG